MSAAPLTGPKPRRQLRPPYTKQQRLALSEARGEMTVRAIRALNMLLESSDERVRLKAAQAILDRSLGKPVQAVLVDATGPELAQRSSAEREATLLAALRAVRGEGKVIVDANVANVVPAIPKETT